MTTPNYQQQAQQLIADGMKGSTGKIPPQIMRNLLKYAADQLKAGTPPTDIAKAIGLPNIPAPKLNTPAPQQTPSQQSSAPPPTDLFDFTHQMLQAVLATAPRQNDPATWSGAPDFLTAYSQWASVYDQALSNADNARKLEVGTIDLGNGQTISQSELNAISPQEQQMVQVAAEQQQAKLNQSVQKLNNDLGISQFNAGINAKQAALEQAKFVEDTNQKAADWASPNGRSSFTPQDLGMTQAARYAGVPANVPFLQFSGTRNVNPGAELNAASANMGVPGNLNPPQLTPYQPLPQMPIPQPTVPGAVPGQATGPAVPSLLPNSPLLQPFPMGAGRPWGFQPG